MKKSTPFRSLRSQGSALLIVLLFLVLLTILTVAFLSRATLERQLSGASFSQSKVDLVAQGSIATIIADLQQEIEAGSNVGAGTTIPTLANGYYYPNTPVNMVPYPVLGGINHATPPTVDGLENLLKISYRGAPFYAGSNYNTSTYPAPTRAPSTAAAVSTTTASLNNRSVTTVRWNAPLLLARQTPTSTTDFTPVSAFVAPDWIYVARDGSNPSVWDTSYIYKPNLSLTGTGTAGTPGTNPVTQRYAYTIYDEGGTLDLNVAGYPSYNAANWTPSTLQPYKTALAHADLTQLPYLSSSALTTATGSSTTMTVSNQIKLINAIVGWRNNSSAAVKNSFPGYSTLTGTIPSTTKSQLSIGYSGYPLDYYVLNAGGFLNAGGLLLRPGNNVNLNVSNQTDNIFTSRQQLIQFFTQGLGQNSTFSSSLAALENVLQYLGTFSRDLSQPSYAPAPLAPVTNGRPVIVSQANGGNSGNGGDATINPALLAITVPGSSLPWNHNNGVAAVAGEPLVKSRFALNRLAWVTPFGPIVDSSTGVLSTNTQIAAIITQLETVYGYPAAFLSQGTAANIQAYFGLQWVANPTLANDDSSNGSSDKVWAYTHGSNVSGAGVGTIGSTPGAILTLSAVSTRGRDADFFELLKAGICAGSIGRTGEAKPGAYTAPNDYQYAKDYDVDFQIIQIGANIIAQAQPTAYAPRIYFDDGTFPGYPQEFRGVEDLPYLYKIKVGNLLVHAATPATTPYQCSSSINAPVTTAPTDYGVGTMLIYPAIWNPHAYAPAANLKNPIPAALRPTSFRVIALSTTPNNASLGTSQAIANSRGGATVAYNQDIGSNTTLPQLQAPVQLSAAKSAITFTIPAATTATATVSSADLFREPTFLCQPNVPAGTNVALANGAVGGYTYSNLLLNDTNISSYVDTTNNALKLPVDAWEHRQQSGYVSTYTSQPLEFLGFYLGSFPLWFQDPTNSSNYIVTTCGVINGNQNFTYRMQYQDPSGNWITFDEKYFFWPFTRSNSWNSQGTPGDGDGSVDLVGDSYFVNDMTTVVDPRTARFGSFANNTLWQPSGPQDRVQPTSGGGTPAGAYWVDWANNTFYSDRPDGSSGFAFNAGNIAAGFVGNYPNGFVTQFDVGPLSQNNPFVPGTVAIRRYQGDGGNSAKWTFYADPDGVVRRAMGAYVPFETAASGNPAVIPGTSTGYTAYPALSPYGVPQKIATSYSPAKSAAAVGSPTVDVASRPVMMNRPFRTVAELGNVFSGTPWKNLSMSTPESGSSALMDLFCVNDTNDLGGLVAGKVNLNTRQTPVLQAILAGAYEDEFYVSASAQVLGSAYINGTGGSAASPMASRIAAALVARTTDTTNVAKGSGPLANLSELVGKWNSSATTVALNSATGAVAPNNVDGSSSYVGFSGGSGDVTNTYGTQTTLTTLSSVLGSSANDATATGYANAYCPRYNEATMRALSNNTTTRVWNLMIDVIAQTGHFPSTAANLASFNVEGERRYWVHVAIDRYTGKVLDEQVEEVKE